MARKASADVIQADMQPPNFRAAVARIRTIKAKRDKLASVNGEIADIYAKVEGHKVNRKAAKIWYMLDGLEGPERMDVMRSLNGLCDASGWDEEAEDLVDAAEGNVVHMRVGRTPDSEEESEQLLDEATTDEFTEATEEELAKQAGRDDKKKLEQAGKQAKARRDAGKPASEPYTGDNSDLAGGE